ncbi:MAG: response regulator [Alphaproteobacteria bacterium]|nr:response regulator [Alphaproteobacteria bacterium]
MASILVIDDDQTIRDAIKLMLETRGHRIHTASDGSKGLLCVEANKIDLVITDVLMPGQEGIETIRSLRQRADRVPILAISGGGQTHFRDALEAARLLGANATLSKPFAMPELTRTVDELLSARTDPASAA